MNTFNTNKQNLILNTNIDLANHKLVKKNEYSWLTSELEYKLTKHKKELDDYQSFKEQFLGYKNTPREFFNEFLRSEILTVDRINYLELLGKENFIAAKVPLAIGTTHFLTQLAIWFYTCFEGSQVIITCPPPSSNFKFADIITLADRYKHLFSYSYPQAPDQVIGNSYDGVSSIKYISIPIEAGIAQRQNKFVGKSAKNLLFIVDQANGMPEDVLQALDTYKKSSNVKILYFYNEGSVSEETNEKFQKYIGNCASFDFSIFNFPNVCYGRNHLNANPVPGCIDQEQVKKNIIEYSRPATSDEVADFVIPYDTRTMFLGLSKKEYRRKIIDSRIKRII